MAILNVFGLNWDTDSSLATKQGYIQTLLRAGVSGQEIKDLIASIEKYHAASTLPDVPDLKKTTKILVQIREELYKNK